MEIKRHINQEDQKSSEIPINKEVIKKSSFLTGQDYSSSAQNHERCHRLPIAPCRYRKPLDSRTSTTTTTTDSDDTASSLKKLQEQETSPVSIDKDELDLSLWFSPNNKKRKIISTDNHPKRLKLVLESDSTVALKLWRMRNYTKQDIAEEERLGVTTKLSLYDPWRKKEKKGDIGNYIYREPPQTTTSHSITSLKRLQEQQTPISVDEDELDLSLWFSNNNKKKRKITTAENQYHSSSLPKRKKFASDSDYAVALNLWKLRNYSKQDMAEEDRLGVTTRLSVYYPWRMTKDLMPSDIGHLSRLMLKSHWAEKYFLPYLDIKQVESEDGVTVKVFDSDTHSEHDLAFKLWKSSNSYVLKKGWVKEFVKRRNLEKGDQIGMFCHVPLMDAPPQSMLKIDFCVLKRAQPKQD